MAGLPQPEVVSEPVAQLRERFNKGQYMARAERGEFRPCLKAFTEAKSIGNLAGMRGYTVGYHDAINGTRVFLVHFFMDGNGNLGASGLADPKWLYEGGHAFVPLIVDP